MDPSVKAAWISSSVALAVAVIGVIATGVAQTRGSKTANANALALFKRQAEEQSEIQSKEAIERRRTAFLADRRAVYAKFLVEQRRLKAEITKIEELKTKNEEFKRRLASLREEPAGSPRLAERVAELDGESAALSPKIDAAHEAITVASREYMLTLEEMFMLAPLDVASAAADWANATEGNDPQPRARFLNAARLDVGAEPLPRLPVV
jgi:hypothetical protein